MGAAHGTLQRALACASVFGAAASAAAASEPPPVVETAPGWNEPARGEEPEPERAEHASDPDVELLAGAQYLWASGKAMPGVTFRVAKDLFALDAEATFVWLTESSPDADVSFLGTEFGGAIMFVPPRLSRFRLSGGLGGDFYSLWNLNADTWEMALVAKLMLHVDVTPSISLFGSARSYLASSSGLDLGAARDGSDGLPVLFGTGIAGSFR